MVGCIEHLSTVFTNKLIGRKGASVRTIPYDEDKTDFTIEVLQHEACPLFFPEGKLKMRNLNAIFLRSRLTTL